MTALRLALAAALLLPTIPRQQTPPLPTIKVDTKLTVVNVTVTDKYGHPVHGLKPSDFVIKEDGKPQPIRNFDEYGLTTPSAQPAPPKLPPGIYTNQPIAAPTGPVNILLFSQLERPADMLYARARAADYIKTMPAGTRTTIMLLDNGVRLLQNLTTNLDVLNAQMDQLKYHPVGGANFATVASLGAACSVANQQSRLTVDALKQIAASMAGIKGRKNLIWFTHGMPWLTNISWLRQYPELACLNDYTRQLHEAYSMLSAAQVSIYAVDPGGLDASCPRCFLERQFWQESIRDYAENTGGAAYYNRNDLDAVIGEAIASGSDYYAVSYTPPLVGYDGKFHTIDVKVNKPGLQLTYRKGYTSLDLARLNNTIVHDKTTAGASQAPALAPAVSQFRAEMAHGAVPSTELLVAARITPVAMPAKPAAPPIKGTLNPSVKPNPLIRYDVIYSLPAGQVTLNENPDGSRKGAVELDIVAYGEDGTKLNVIRQQADVTLKPQDVASFQANPFEVPLQLDLPPGKLFVRVGVLDVTSGKAGTLEEPITVARPKP